MRLAEIVAGGFCGGGGGAPRKDDLMAAVAHIDRPCA